MIGTLFPFKGYELQIFFLKYGYSVFSFYSPIASFDN